MQPLASDLDEPAVLTSTTVNNAGVNVNGTAPLKLRYDVLRRLG